MQKELNNRMIYEEVMSLPMIDSHCHLLMTEPNDMDFGKVLSMSLYDMPVEQTHEVLNYKRWQSLLKQFNGVEHAILNSKQSMEASGCSDYPGYIAKLFGSVNLQRLVIDLGYEPAKVDLPEFESILPANVSYFYRIETFLDSAWEKKDDFDRLIEEFEMVIKKSLDKEKIVGIKSIIGYRTGIDVEWVGREEAKERYNKGDEKGFRDYCLRLAADLTREAGKVLKLHTGVGESNINIMKNNPLLLKKFIGHYQEPPNLRILLLHGGYPYTFEAGYMAGTFPNVWYDLSCISSWFCLDTKRELLKIMEYAPLNKLVYGSDGYIVPELHWFGAKSMKIEFCKILESLVDREFIDSREAVVIARNIFAENAKRLFLIKK